MPQWSVTLPKQVISTMSDNNDGQSEAQNENELAGLDAKEAAQQIHDDIRFRLEPANEYKWGDPESEAFAELADRLEGRLAASPIRRRRVMSPTTVDPSAG